jgi:proteasome lid subunit RPN8/RPN11
MLQTVRSIELIFNRESWKTLRRLSEEAYPFEGCGLLLGPLGEEKIVQQVVPLRNMLCNQGRGRFDFLISPEEFLAAQLAAEQQQWDVLGIFHTHPDHPPCPSLTDSRQPMLSRWINVIAAVYGGEFKEARGWYREEDPLPFQEIMIVAV